MGALIILLGIVIFLIGGLLFLVAAFRESIWWGLACLFLPVVSFFFLIVHWREARKPFFLQLLGFVVLLVGVIISPQTLHRWKPSLPAFVWFVYFTAKDFRAFVPLLLGFSIHFPTAPCGTHYQYFSLPAFFMRPPATRLVDVLVRAISGPAARAYRRTALRSVVPWPFNERKFLFSFLVLWYFHGTIEQFFPIPPAGIPELRAPASVWPGVDGIVHIRARPLTSKQIKSVPLDSYSLKASQNNN
jgi:hypothetical protein